jgi:SAM-dependent methyltransferase
VHRVPRVTFIDRVEVIRSLVRGRRVIDLGFVDEDQMAAKHVRGDWLHQIVCAEARQCVGVDVDAAGVELARGLGFDAYSADLQDRIAVADLRLDPAELVLAGELLEHLDRPGDFLEAVKALVAPGGLLVLTTPNAHALTNVFGAVAGKEFVNPDHVGWFSWKTLETLLQRHGWRLDFIAFYRFPRVESGPRLQRTIFNAYQVLAAPFFRLRPQLADGILASARLAGPEIGRPPHELRTCSMNSS